MKKIIVVIIAAVIIVTAVTVALKVISSQSVNSDIISTDYYFEASCLNADAEMSINGNIVFTTDPNSANTSNSITSWATPYLTAGDVDVSVRYINRQGSDMISKMEFSISSCPHGSPRSEGVVLLEDSITPDSSQVESSVDGAVLRDGVQKNYTLSIPSANIPTWSWESGSDISNISQSQEDDLWDTIVALRSTMDDATDPKELLPVFEEKTSNLAAALYKTNGELESQLITTFTSFLNDSNWGMKSINRADLSYYNINSKLIKVEGTDGVTLFESDPLSASFEGNTFKVDVYFALISNEWKIVR